MPTKICNKCKIVKVLEDFHRNAASADGHAAQCKPCAIARSRDWTLRNKDRANAKSRDWQREHRTERKQYMKSYYEANKEKLIANNVQWNRDHPETVKQIKAEYRKRVKEDRDNVIRSLLMSAKTRATKHNREFLISETFIRYLIDIQNERCKLTGWQFVYETDPMYRSRPFAPSIDRIDSTLGYTHGNVQMVCNVVNRAKNEFGRELFDDMCRARVAVLESM